MTHKYRFVGIKLCKPTEKYNITILHEEDEQAILRCFEVTLCIAVTQSDHFGNRKTLRALKINYLQGFVVPGAELLILYSIVVDCFVNTLKTNDI